MALTAVHTLVYTDDPPATRAFFRDVLRLPFVADGDTDSPTEEDWLIFATGPSELGVHPVMPGGAPSGRHQITFMCDDLDATVAELTGRGATFSGEPADLQFGRVAMVQVPGSDDVMLYEPRHTTAFDQVG